MAKRVAVINVVGLSESLIGDASPRIRAFLQSGSLTRLTPDLPAVTCTSQSTMLTGVRPEVHGIVGNGWYDREDAEVKFWKQSNHLVRASKVWETARARDASFTCAQMFWWYNMYSRADVSVTPRPMYKADGRKIPDCYSDPPEWRHTLQRELGQFPLFRFWGPAASIESTRWIADASLIVHDRFKPTLMLVYLPHLDYPLQKLGPDHPDIPVEVAKVDAVVGDLLEAFERDGVEPIIVSEYGIEPVDTPVELNRVLRRAELLRVRVEDETELLDAGASEAFAVCDHQVAHVYVRTPRRIAEVAALLCDQPGVAEVLDADAQRERGLHHDRSGELLVVASARAWFHYRYWLDDRRAPDFARTVDIHRKPGYDPCELFIDPAIAAPKLKLAAKLLRKKLGFRTLMDVIPLDPTLVQGSHGRVDMGEAHQPVLITRDGSPGSAAPMTAVRDVILDRLGLM